MKTNAKDIGQKDTNNWILVHKDDTDDTESLVERSWDALNVHAGGDDRPPDCLHQVFS